MRAQKSGHILTLTSIAGLVAFPGSGLYNASKFALEGFTEALRHEGKPFGIRVPLSSRTPSVPDSRAVQP